MVKKNKKNYSAIIVSSFIALIMILSIFGIVIGNSNNTGTEKYNGYKFGIRYFQDTTIPYYVTKINNKEVKFYYFPTELEEYNLTNSEVNLLKNSQLILTAFDPFENETDLAPIELAAYELSQTMDKQVVRAVTKENSTYSLMVLDCANASIYTPMIYFKIGDESKIQQNGSCITVSAPRQEILRMKDVIVYNYYGVINGYKN